MADIFSKETIQRCVQQLDSLIDDRKSFLIGDKECDEIFLEDIFYLEIAKKILSDILQGTFSEI